MYTNDIIDLISDFNGEPINCVAVAARYGGLNAVIGYADACATCVDDCAKCDCAAGDAAHDWAVDGTQGMLTTYQLVPRYVAMTQMAEMNHLTGQMYKDLLSSARHGAFTSGKVAKFQSNEPALHDTEWKPIFDMVAIPPYGGTGECSHCQTITTWLVNRGLYRERRNILEKQVRDFVKEHVHLNPSPEMKNFWGELLVLLAGEECPAEIVQECARVVESTWNLLRFAGEIKADVNLVRKRQIELYFDVCKVITRTHEFPNGHHVRRVVVGLISVMGDRTDVSVFQRILDGLLEYSG
ncbi:uncharacterized protein LOC110862501 [Folsomia candida]|nr:uncharacterized protein LOC110862501 [Folsomia candida]